MPEVNDQFMDWAVHQYEHWNAVEARRKTRWASIDITLQTSENVDEFCIEHTERGGDNTTIYIERTLIEEMIRRFDERNKSTKSE